MGRHTLIQETHVDLEKLREQVQEQPEVQQCPEGPFSRAFLRGHARIGVRTLDTMAYKWPKNSQSLVELIVNYLLTDDERGMVFPSAYDMGNRQILDSESTRPARISEYLQVLFTGRAPKPLLKSVKDDIKQWTGHEFRAYWAFDRSIATKVLCGLYEFRAWNRPTLTSLLQRLEPARSFSSEFRSAWPFTSDGESARKAREIVAVVADLKAMMTFQMGSDHDHMRQVLLLLQCQFETRSFPHVFSTLKGYRPMKAQVIQELTTWLPQGSAKAAGRLDQALYIYLTLLEIEHKLHATDALVEFLSTDSSIPVLTNLEPSGELLYDENEIDAHQIFDGLESITGIHIERQERQFYWNCSSLVLAMSLRVSEEISLVERFSALAAVSGTRVQELEYPIWWKGYKSISQRPWFYLTSAVEALSENTIDSVIDTVPYGYREFWAQRYSLIVHRALRAEEVWLDCNYCASEEIRMVVEMFRSMDADVAVQHADAYIQMKIDNSRRQSDKILADR